MRITLRDKNDVFAKGYIKYFVKYMNLFVPFIIALKAKIVSTPKAPPVNQPRAPTSLQEVIMISSIDLRFATS